MQSTTQMLKNVTNKSVRLRIRELVQPGTLQVIIEQEVNSILADSLNNILKAEQDQALQRASYERSDNPVYRNGFKPFSIPGLTGRLNLSRPVVRKGTLHLPFLNTLKKAGKYLINLTALRFWTAGASTRNTAAAVNDLFGSKISASDVSAVTDCLEPAFTEWEKRPIPSNITYLFLDATYIPVCRHKLNLPDSVGFTKKQAVLAALGIDSSGNTHVLGFLLGDRENSDSWNALVQSLIDKGLKPSSLRLVISDEHKAIIEAVASKLAVPHQYCLFHKLQNVRLRVPSQDKKALIQDLIAVYWAHSKDDALVARGRFESKWGQRYPKATQIAFSNFDNYTMFFNEPKSYWRALRTSNRIERFNRELKRRLRPAGAMHSENELSKILWSVSISQEKSWLKRKAFRPVTISSSKEAA